MDPELSNAEMYQPSKLHQLRRVINSLITLQTQSVCPELRNYAQEVEMNLELRIKKNPPPTVSNSWK